MIDSNVLVIFEDGNTHEVSATIHILNLSNKPLANIQIQRFDVGSFDDLTSSGFINNNIHVLNPGESAVIDKLSTFDLEFINSYNITYVTGKKESGFKFEIGKYGKFDEDHREKDISMKLAGRVVHTELMGKAD